MKSNRVEVGKLPSKLLLSPARPVMSAIRRVPLAGWLLCSMLTAIFILGVVFTHENLQRCDHSIVTKGTSRFTDNDCKWFGSTVSTGSCVARRARRPVGSITAYLVMVHTAARLEGARQLLEQIFDPSDLFVIHADAAIDIKTLETYKIAMSKCSNVQFVSEDERVRGAWGRWSLVEIELSLLRHALASDVAWDQTILLDGSTWPIGDAADRQAWIENYRRLVAVGGDPRHRPFACRRPEWCQNRHEQAKCETDECTTMSNTVHNGVIYKRSQWFVLPRSAAAYMTYGPAAEEWFAYFNVTSIPDEHWAVSVQYAQPGGPTGDLPIPVGTIWGRCLAHPADNSPHPCSLGMADLPRIRPIDSPFVRKLELGELELRQTLVRGDEKQIRFPLPKKKPHRAR